MWICWVLEKTHCLDCFVVIHIFSFGILIPHQKPQKCPALFPQASNLVQNKINIKSFCSFPRSQCYRNSCLSSFWVNYLCFHTSPLLLCWGKRLINGAIWETRLGFGFKEKFVCDVLLDKSGCELAGGSDWTGEAHGKWSQEVLAQHRRWSTDDTSCNWHRTPSCVQTAEGWCAPFPITLLFCAPLFPCSNSLFANSIS